MTLRWHTRFRREHALAEADEPENDETPPQWGPLTSHVGGGRRLPMTHPCHVWTASSAGDGIVLASSSHNVVTGNRVSDNRVGVLVRESSQRNVIRGKVLAAQGSALHGNDVQADGRSGGV
jgi:parallel beta-helix repeat protein